MASRDYCSFSRLSLIQQSWGQGHHPFVTSESSHLITEISSHQFGQQGFLPSRLLKLIKEPPGGVGTNIRTGVGIFAKYYSVTSTIHPVRIKERIGGMACLLGLTTSEIKMSHGVSRLCIIE